MKEHTLIKDIMTADPISVLIGTPISEIIGIIEDNDFDHLPVLDAEDEVRGIISKTDLYRKVLHLSRSTSGKSYSEKLLDATPACEVMTTEPTTIDINAHAGKAIELLLKGQFHALPVVENNRLVGMVTSKDLLHTVIDRIVVGA